MKPELKGDWVRMFREECVVRTGNDYPDSDAEAFYRYYGDAPHEAVLRYMKKYGLADIPAAQGRTVFYVVSSDDEGAWLRDGDPGDDYVLWVGTDQFEAECNLCKACNG